MSALTDQLVKGYLEGTDRRHGIYLVYWIAPDQRPAEWPARPDDPDTLLAKLRSQAAQLEPDYVIRPIILDISRPSS